MVTQTRTLNRTDRQRINHTAVEWAVDRDAGVIQLNKLRAENWLSHIDEVHQADAKVNFDLRASGYFRRESFTSVGDLTADAWSGFAMHVPKAYLGEGRRMTLRVSVVRTAEPDRGLILASADEITINEGPGGEFGPSGDNSPLAVQLSDDLTTELWRLRFNEENGPKLQVNNDLAEHGWKEFIRNKIFQFTILPAVLRQVFTEIAYDTDAKVWHEVWLGFTASPGSNPALRPETEYPLTKDAVKEVTEWVETCVQRCSNTGKHFDKFLPAWKKLREEG